ncbi:MAG: hypothetical protein HC927_10240, partial [Deltaproteobacteria bacterium]|nr:hypothetical protein [Deltaproteobacteria bacterium]
WTRAGKLERVVYDDGSFEQFGYRADGLLAFARNGTCTIKLDRDALGRITREWQDERWIASSYDRAGNRTSVRSSFGTRVDVEVDAMGRWSGVGLGDGVDIRWRANTQRNLVGDEVDRYLPGGARDRWGRDQLGRPTQHQVWDGRSVVRDLRYTWNVDARLDRLLDVLTGVPTEYGHDALGQLAWARKGQDTAELRLPDMLGNIYRSGERVDRFYGADGRLLFAEEATGTTRYEYDADGQRVLRRDPDGGEWKYRWNRAGRLVAVERPDGLIVEFGHDALGRRVWKRCGGRTTRWVWDGDAIFHEWTEATESVESQEPLERTTLLPGVPGRGSVMARGPPPPSHGIVGEDESTGYVEPAFVPRKLPQATVQPAPRGLITWLSDPETLAPMAKLVEGRAYSVVCDHLGTPIAMFDEIGRRVWAMEMTTWGERRIVQGEAGDCPFRFLGQVEDLETGLYYNRFREYDPRAGQYLCVDPIRLAGGLNSFAYVGDPLVEVDPLGLAKRIQRNCAASDQPPPRGAGGWSLNPEVDLDWRGTGRDHRDALAEAFRLTGAPRSEFVITRWGRSADGKSFPVEWRVQRGPHSGAEVNIDMPHAKNGPAEPHVGYQSSGKRNRGGTRRGHIILDDVPYNRIPDL